MKNMQVIKFTFERDCLGSILVGINGLNPFPFDSRYCHKLEVSQHVHWFLEGKDLGIQQGTRVRVGSPKSASQIDEHEEVAP